MIKRTLFGIKLPKDTKKDILEKIKKYIAKPIGICHIVSLNPEIVMIAQKNEDFKKAVTKAKIKIVDGVGIVLAARILGFKAGERYPGVELMEDMIKMASEQRLRVLLIGGRENLADELADCYSEQFPEARFRGVVGILDIENPRRAEEEKIFSIVASYKPHIILVAFGSPVQELWIERHSKKLKGKVVMGVGGAFDFLSGKIGRAPAWMRSLGLEWFYRLLVQPWRWQRQLRLLEFAKLVFKQRFLIKDK